MKSIYNKFINCIIFSIIGILAYHLLANFSGLREIVHSETNYIFGYFYFIFTFNIIGYALIKLSYIMRKRISSSQHPKTYLILLYGIIGILLFILNYGIIILFKNIFGLAQPFTIFFPGYRLLVILWFIEMIILSLLMTNHTMMNNLQMQKQSAQLIEENNQAKYLALQEQLNPHFLFNSLNTLIAEIEYDPHNAVEFTRRLSDVYRYVLQSQQRTQVSIIEELEFIKAYLYLLKVRKGNYITFKNQLSTEQSAYIIPPLALQTVFENIYKHNTISSQKMMTIELYIQDEYVCVRNTLHKKQSNYSQGTGLKNLASRCELMFHKTLQIEEDAHFFTVKIPYLYE